MQWLSSVTLSVVTAVMVLGQQTAAVVSVLVAAPDRVPLSAM